MRHNGAVSHKLSLKKSLKMWYTIKYGGHTSTLFNTLHNFRICDQLKASEKCLQFCINFEIRKI